MTPGVHTSGFGLRAPRRSMRPRLTPCWWPSCASRVRRSYVISGAESNPAPSDGQTLARHPADVLHQHLPLGHLDPLVQAIDVVVVLDRNHRLGDDHAGVDAGIDHE